MNHHAACDVVSSRRKFRTMSQASLDFVSYAACFFWNLFSVLPASFLVASAALRPSSSCLCRIKDCATTLVRPQEKYKDCCMQSLQSDAVAQMCRGARCWKKHAQRRTAVNSVESEVDGGQVAFGTTLEDFTPEAAGLLMRATPTRRLRGKQRSICSLRGVETTFGIQY